MIEAAAAIGERSSPVSELPESLLREMCARRGRAFAFERLPVRRTALVAIDLTDLFFGTSEAELEVATRLNRLAAHLRARGGGVLWVRPAPFAFADLMSDLMGRERLDFHARAQTDGDPRNRLAASLVVGPGDLFTRKNRFSAFFPGSSDAMSQLSAHGFDHALVAGVVTDVCVEASARDACSCGLRTVLLSDATIGSSPDAHMNALTGFHRRFGDVRTVEEVMAILV